MIDIHEELSLSGKRLMLLEPYYGLFMLTLNKVIKPEVGTAGVRRSGINIELSIAPDFWNKLTDDQKIGLFKHELIHVCLNHPIVRDEYADPILFNFAADIEINQYIADRYMPPDPCTLDSFNLGHEKKFAGTAYYYKLLEKEKKGGKNPALNEAYAEAMADAMAQVPQLHVSHPGWGEFEDLNESEKRLIEAQIQHQSKDIAQHCKSRGLIPSELSEFVEALFKIIPPSVKWEQLLKRFIGGSKEVYTKKTRRKQSKRIHGNPGIKVKIKPFGAIYWDVSGSVSEAEDKMFFSEIKHMYKAGLNFDIIPFNAEVLKPYRYKGQNSYYAGTGGTCFTPISEHFNKNKHKYSFGVILTDGWAEVPPKFFKPMLWVITPGGVEIDDMQEYPGVKIKMKDNEFNN